jgi:26S proteasome regulatory subunit N12
MDAAGALVAALSARAAGQAYSAGEQTQMEEALVAVEEHLMAPGNESDQKALELQRSLLEHMAWAAIGGLSAAADALGEDGEFARCMAQLKPFYANGNGNSVLPESPHAPALLGLNLMRLLSTKNLPLFHTEMELLPPSIRSSEFVAFAHRLERAWSEGAYHKILRLPASSAPDPAYKPMLDVLNGSIRDEVAGCMESSFGTGISVAAAAKLLDLTSDVEAKELAQRRGWSVVQNGQSGEQIVFQEARETSHTDKESSFVHIRRSLQYAGEMERIV